MQRAGALRTARQRCPLNNRNYFAYERINICIFTLPSRLFSSKLPKLNNYRPADVRSTCARNISRNDRLLKQRPESRLFIDLGRALLAVASRVFMTKSCENDLRRSSLLISFFKRDCKLLSLLLPVVSNFTSLSFTFRFSFILRRCANIFKGQ